MNKDNDDGIYSQEEAESKRPPEITHEGVIWVPKNTVDEGAEGRGCAWMVAAIGVMFFLYFAGQALLTIAKHKYPPNNFPIPGEQQTIDKK